MKYKLEMASSVSYRTHIKGKPLSNLGEQINKPKVRKTLDNNTTEQKRLNHTYILRNECKSVLSASSLITLLLC